MNATLYRAPQELAPDTIVVSYYPLIGNEANTASRYAEEANLTGYNYLGIARDGSDTTHFSLALRRQLSPENFDDFWADQSRDLPDMLKDYDNIIIRGQSAGSFPALSLVKTGVVEATHLVIEDGINLRTGLFGKRRNPLQAKLDWAINKFQEGRADTEPQDKTWFIPTKGNDSDVVKKFAVEVAHWSPLWQSDYSRQSALEIIASKPKLPILLAFLGHSATAGEKDLQKFWQDVASSVTTRQALDPAAAEVKCLRNLDAWHNILEYPQYSAQNVQHVMRLK